MVETCLSVEDNELHEFEYPCTLSVSSTMNLSSSMSSLTLGSPNDKEFSTCDSLKNVSIAASYPANALSTNNETKRNSISQNSITKQRSLKYKSKKWLDLSAISRLPSHLPICLRPQCTYFGFNFALHLCIYFVFLLCSEPILYTILYLLIVASHWSFQM